MISETKPDTLPIPTDAVPSQPAAPKRSGKKIQRIIVIGLGVFACCLLVVGLALVSTLINSGREKASVAKILDAYMYAMKVKNPERAYEFVYTMPPSKVSVSMLQELLDGRMYRYFDGYKSITVDTFSVEIVLKENPNSPRGIVYIANGTVFYEGGVQSSLTARLGKVDGEWKIIGMIFR